MIRARKAHHTMRKGTIHLGDVAILNAHTPNDRAATPVSPELVRLNGEADTPTAVGKIQHHPLHDWLKN